MFKLNFSTDSWHFKLIKWTDSGDTDSVNNICSYTRAFILSLLKIVAITAFCTLMLVPMTSALVVGLAKLFHFSAWHWMYGLTSVGIGMWLGIALLLSIGAIAVWNEDRKERLRNQPDQQPSALQSMYRSFKDKTCVQIEFK